MGPQLGRGEALLGRLSQIECKDHIVSAGHVPALARRSRIAHDPRTRLSWLLPLSLVSLVGILMGAGHLLFVRWMQRATAAEPTADHPSDERGDEAR